MNRPFGLGAMSVVAGGMLYLLNVLSRIVDGGSDRFQLSIISIVGEERFSGLAGLSDGSIKSSLDYVITMQLYLLLFCVGLFFILLSGFKKH